MPSLAELQREFARALHDPRAPAPRAVKRSAPTAASRRFDVYRNNVVAGLVDALKAAYPAVHRLVGEEYFAAVARVYVREHPPRSPLLMYYGGELGGFLDQFPSASKVPYLGDVARLEWARVTAHHARDAEPVAVSALAAVPESQLEALTFRLHPSLSLIRSRWPVVSLWRATTDPDKAGAVDMHAPERAVVLRPALNTCVHLLSPGDDAFLDALARGAALGEAANRAAETEQGFDLAAQLQLVFRIGAVTAVNPPADQRDNKSS